MKYSAFLLAYEALRGHAGWKRVWRDATPKAEYDVIIVGGGGHGLATAYYLAKEHGLNNIAVVEKGWIGSGNAGRNTTIIRSNYLLTPNMQFYEWSMKLWEGLERDLNYNTMVSQRGVHKSLSLRCAARCVRSPRQCHAPPWRGCGIARSEANSHRCCRFSITTTRAFRSTAGCCNAAAERHGTMLSFGAMRAPPTCAASTSSKTAKLWGFPFATAASQASRLRAAIYAQRKVGLAVAGNTSRLAAMAGLRLPIESHVIQAFVSEGIKPVIDCVMTFGAGHFYISQSDKGGLVFGGDLDGYNTYAQRGNLPTVEDIIEGGVALWPGLGRLRVLRHWGGIVDMTHGRQPNYRSHADRRAVP